MKLNRLSLLGTIAISLIHQSSPFFQSFVNRLFVSHCPSQLVVVKYLTCNNHHATTTSICIRHNGRRRRSRHRSRISCTRNSMKKNEDHDAHDNPSSFLVESSEEKGDDEEEVEFFVTDEEALLACRAYLQRKNKLGWIQSNQRKLLAKNSLALAQQQQQQSQQSQQSLTQSSSSSYVDDSDSFQFTRNVNAGYFWEDPSELVYLRRSRPRRIVQKNKLLGEGRNSSINNNDSYDFEFMDNTEDNRESSINDNVLYENVIEDENDAEEDEKSIEFHSASSETNSDDEGGIFTSFPSYPPATHLKQSQYRKTLFSNPQWKEEWYIKRWGGQRMKQKREQLRKQKKLKALVQKIPSDILRSPELAELTDEEIEDAIKTYIMANKKRRRTHLKLNNQKSDGFGSINILRRQEDYVQNDDAVENDHSSIPLSFTPSENLMKERNRLNSERSKKAYETRILKNQLKNVDNVEEDARTKARIKQQKRSLKEITVEGKLSPRQAVERIEEMIHDRKKPFIHDIDTVLTPKRLGGRKELLGMILSECFNLKGKCVPDISSLNKDPAEFYLDATMDDIDGMSKKFVTQSTIAELGLFIKVMLK